MWKLIWRGITRQRSRFVATVVALALGLAFLTTALGVKDLMVTATTDSTTVTLGGDLYAVGALAKDANPQDVNARGTIDMGIIADIEKVDGVAHAVPMLTGSAVLLNQDQQPLTTGWFPTQSAPIPGATTSGTATQSTPPQTTPTQVIGAFPYPPGPDVDDGRLPNQPDEIMLEVNTAARAGLGLDDEATLVRGGETLRLKVVGLSRYEQPVGAATLAFVDGATAKDWFAPEGRVRIIGIDVGPAANQSTVQKRIQETVGPNATILTGAELRHAQAATVARELRGITVAYTIFLVVFLVFTLFLTGTGMTVQLRSSRRSLDTLRALGYSPSARRALVLGHAFLTSLIAVVLGVLFGALLTLGARSLLVLQGWVLAPGFPLQTWRLVEVPLLGIGLTLLSALPAAIRAGREHSRDVAPGRLRALPAVLGAFAQVAALALAAVTAFAELPLPPIVLLGGVAGLWLLGLVLLLPALSRPFLAIFDAFLKRNFPAHLAIQNLRQDSRHLRRGTTVLVLGVAIATAGGVVADTTLHDLRHQTETEVSSELIVTPLYPVTNVDAAMAAINKTDGAHASTPVIDAPVLVTVDSHRPLSITAAGIDPKNFPLKPTLVEGDLDSLSRGKILVNSRDAKAHGWQLGDEITLTGARGIYSSQIGAILDSALLRDTVFVDRQYLDQVAAPQTVTRSYIFVDLTTGQEESPTSKQLRETQAELQRVLDPLHIFRVQTVSDLGSIVSSTAFQVLQLLYVVLALALVLGLWGLRNALAVAVVQRRSSFTVVQILGMQPGEIAKCLRWEGFLMALVGTVLGWISGVILGAVTRLGWSGVEMFTLSVPVLGQVVAIILALVLALVVGSWIGAKVRKAPEVQAILAS